MLYIDSHPITVCDHCPPGAFVPLRDFVPDLLEDMRYATANNFVGQVIPGYASPVAYVTPELGQAVAKAQAQFLKQGLTLVVYDAYRPLRATRFFRQWAQQPETGLAKANYYPNYERMQLFTENFIAEYSSHCRGAAVDVTLAPIDSPDTPLDMGTPFDFFDERSFTDSSAISSEAQANRHLLKTVMADCGLENLETEWWHYMLIDEPYPTTYFDWVIGPI